MIANILFYLEIILLILAAFFASISVLGLYRFKDLYSRIHAQGILEISATFLLSLALLLHSKSIIVAAKVILLFFIIFYTSPVITTMFAKIAIMFNIEPKVTKIIGKPPHNV